MSSLFSLGEVMSCVDGEILLYGWLESDESIKSIEDYFDEVIQKSEVKEIKCDTFLAETIQMDTQDSITRAKNVLEVQLRLLS